MTKNELLNAISDITVDAEELANAAKTLQKMAGALQEKLEDLPTEVDEITDEE